MAKKKSAVFTRLMHDTKMSAQLRKALNSPVGSAERRKIRTILRPILTVANRTDGQGGPTNFISGSATIRPEDMAGLAAGVAAPSNAPVVILPDFRSFVIDPITGKFPTGDTPSTNGTTYTGVVPSSGLGATSSIAFSPWASDAQKAFEASITPSIAPSSAGLSVKGKGALTETAPSKPAVFDFSKVLPTTSPFQPSINPLTGKLPTGPAPAVTPTDLSRLTTTAAAAKKAPAATTPAVPKTFAELQASWTAQEAKTKPAAPAPSTTPPSTTQKKEAAPTTGPTGAAQQPQATGATGPAASTPAVQEPIPLTQTEYDSIISNYQKQGFSLDAATTLANRATEGRPLDTSGPTNSLATPTDSITAGFTGPVSFAFHLLGDKNLLAQATGMDPSLIPDNMTPFMSKYLMDLKDNLKKEYGITELRNTITDRLTKGMNIENDLTNYIVGKDTFLDSINKQIDNARAWSHTLDVTDPIVQSGAKNYLDYLYTLKGRQQQTYTNLVNQAVTEYDNQTKALQAQYEKNYADFAEEYTGLEEITKESYQWSKEMIAELWDNIQNRDTLLTSKIENDNKYIKAMKENIALTTGAYSDVSDYSLNYNDYKQNIVEIGDKKEIPYEFNASGDPSKSIIIPDNDIYQKMAEVGTMKSNQSGDLLSPAGVIKYMTDSIGENIPKVVDIGTTKTGMKDAVNTYANRILEYWKNHGMGSTDAIEQAMTKQNASSLASALVSAINKGIFSQLSSAAELTTVKDALKDLVSPSGVFRKAPSAQEVKAGLPSWKAKYSGTINPSVLDALEMAVLYKLDSSAENPSEIFTVFRDSSGNRMSKGSIDDLTAGDVADIITFGYRVPFAQLGLVI